MIDRIAFTMYPVVDVEAARGFYETVLGLEPGMVGNHGDIHWIEYDLPGGGCLAITNASGTPSAEAGGTIAFEVEDLDVLIEHLRGRDVRLRGDIVAGPNCRMITCLDPDGNSIVLHQRNR
jgi:predicted enzyme related to lactoylglutathione lyase